MREASLNERAKCIGTGFSRISKGYERTASVILHPIQGVGVVLLVDMFTASKIQFQPRIRLVGCVSAMVLSGGILRK
ncbi:hypothetical protein SNOG_20022 [Parastagonospora nodorum SN15]|uniref:Uncharacterized protein n=1 Tax=Phaeosphaeria nodorum (strain SN15 / ATCC MYA-4574 / FGSC 10173) TaxID=321614 RepID=A9JX19_PHANO|nr:hypothetical protein SNOG_20022 [Parastagonospora nodorum SN15]EDP89847.1 hypothetical protein SNOG_20022 [Parastagonospora nodorum SN15]